MVLVAVPVAAQQKKLRVESKKPAKSSAKTKSLRPSGLPSMNITKELITPGQAKRLEAQLRKQRASAVLQKGQFDAKSRKIIDDWARWAVYSLTLKELRDPPPKPKPAPGAPGDGMAKAAKPKEDRPTLHGRYDEIMRKIRISGRLLAKNNPAAGKQFRTILCNAVARRAADLLDNHFRVRIYAVLILSQMNVVEVDSNKKTLPLAYIPAADTLVEKVIKVPQPDAVKVVAVNGLRRLALLGRPKQATKRKMANALIPLLANPQTHPWLQMRTARALGAIGEKTNLNGQAFIVQALTKTMIDESRMPPVRCAAARALGRVDIAPSVDVNLVAYELVRVTKELAEKFNADCAAKKARKIAAVPSYWSKCGREITYAFHPQNDLETRLYGNRKPGLLKRFPQLKSQFTTIVPILSHLWQQGRVPERTEANKFPAPIFTPVRQSDIDTVQKWLASNKPSVNSVQPNILPALRAGMKAASAKSAETVPTASR